MKVPETACAVAYDRHLLLHSSLDTKRPPGYIILMDVSVEAAEVEGGSWWWKRASATSSSGVPIMDTGSSDALQTPS